MKKILLILILLLLCGCTTNYRLEISNDKFVEHINIFVDGERPENDKKYDQYGAEIDNPLISFFDGDVYSVMSEKYKKKVEYTDYGSNIILDYTYNEEEFGLSNSLNNCFDNVEYSMNDTYYIHLSGNFKCQYSDSVDVEILTKNKVLLNNAHEVNGRSYVWHITENNVDSVDIEIEVEKGISINNIIVYSSIIIVVVLIIGCLYIFYKKRLYNNSI